MKLRVKDQRLNNIFCLLINIKDFSVINRNNNLYFYAGMRYFFFFVIHQSYFRKRRFLFFLYLSFFLILYLSEPRLLEFFELRAAVCEASAGKTSSTPSIRTSIEFDQLSSIFDSFRITNTCSSKERCSLSYSIGIFQRLLKYGAFHTFLVLRLRCLLWLFTQISIKI